jgi:type II restriction enzyme
MKYAEGYKSNSQIVRVITEQWVKENSYCPCCGNLPLQNFENNKPVADFFCKQCSEQFELKSKSGKLTNTINDGAYQTMMERISSNKNPNFFFLSYSKNWSVENFLIIPKQFFIPEIIIKRKALSASAKRAGWVGCNIDISGIAQAGKVFLIKNSIVVDKSKVAQAFNQTLFLREKNIDTKGWILDIMRCVDYLKNSTFTLDEMYAFENNLKAKYPNNNFIKDKIRQQLQLLRDKGLIEFIGRGKYKKTVL